MAAGTSPSSFSTSDFTGLEHGNGYPISQENAVGGDGGDTRAGSENAQQIQRVRGIDHQQLASGGGLADRTQQANRLGQGELLAAGAVDEMAAANFTAGLKTAIYTTQFIPGGAQGFPLEQPAEYNPVSTQQNPGEGFDGGLARQRQGRSIERQRGPGSQ